ncbi:7270_t:CDS:10 [Ambispora gerdemannii]|uniref:7270_t:CDS:1 n=1 Tax=Ambispora gerdemannii TaxID=144530 RepID=A0A9N9C712_9GLOM|nr:7270_t:CDS:10 [Ambispora gerdemannii]
MDRDEISLVKIATIQQSNANNEKNNKDKQQKEMERQILRKMDFRLIPLLALLYLMSFLDRVNIGNAKLANLEADLGLHGAQYNWALSIFFFGYISIEIPSNIILMKTKPSLWIPFIMFLWGGITALMSLVKNFTELMVTRFFLGLAEGGLFPGVVFYLTLWYRRSEQNFRISLFFAASGAAGAFGGLIAYAIMKMHGVGGLAGWQWIFILEGLSTIVIAFAAFFWITDYARSARWLTQEEREFAEKRLKEDAGVAYIPHFDKRHLKAAFQDWKIYLAMVMSVNTGMEAYSFTLFLPVIIKGLGFERALSQLLTVPPYVLAAIVTVFVAVHSDKTGYRGPYIVVSAAVGIIGYIMMIFLKSVTGKYIASMIIAMGLFPCIGTGITWITNNLAGDAKRAIGAALLTMSANIGGIFAGQIYRANDAPHYTMGHTISGVSLLGVLITAVIFEVLLKRVNRLKVHDPERFTRNLSEDEIKNLGDWHPGFYYTL